MHLLWYVCYVTVPAQITIQPVEMTTVDFGSTVNIVCVAFGVEPPNIRWTRGNQMLYNDTQITIYEELITERNQTFTQSILEICSLNVSDSGNYGCVATNSRGNDSAAFVLTVTERGMHNLCVMYICTHRI